MGCEKRIEPRALAHFARERLLSCAVGLWPGYAPAPHHRAIAEKLEAVERGEIKRLMISMPPRHGKSMLCSEFFPAWYLGRNPEKQVIFATYSQDLAEDFGRRARNWLRDKSYRSIFPGVEIAADSSAASRFAVGERGAYFAVGVGASITGRGADVLLIDDPLKGREEADSETMRRRLKDWYTSVAYTRLMPGGAIVIVQTRWHPDDLSGWIIEEHAHESWDVLSLPAISPEGAALWPGRYPIETLETIKATLPARDWSALYQQSPIVEGGNILKSHWWRKWDSKHPPDCSYILQSWDTAFSEKDVKTNSFNALTTWGVFVSPDGNRALVMIDAWRGRVDYPTLRAEALKSYKKHQPDCVIVEKKSRGKSLIQDLRRYGIPVVEYQPDTDKVSRAYAVQAMLEAGQIYYPPRRWAEEVINECALFPNCINNDYVDTCTQAWLRVRNAGLLIPSPPAEPVEPDIEPLFARDRKEEKRAIYG